MYINKTTALFLINTFLLTFDRFTNNDHKTKMEWIKGMRALGVTFYSDPELASDVWVKTHDFDFYWWQRLAKAIRKEFGTEEFRLVSPRVFRFCRDYCLKKNLVWIELRDFTRDFGPSLQEFGL